VEKPSIASAVSPIYGQRWDRSVLAEEHALGLGFGQGNHWPTMMRLFRSPEIDNAQMQEFCIRNMKEMGMPGFVARIFTRWIPKLKRWKEK
jgi:hypothetical protein